VPDIIQGVDYTDFLKYIRIKSERSYRRTYCILAEGKEVLGYNVDETSKKVIV